jgi:putative peptidoglycan lipid II flippase
VPEFFFIALPIVLSPAFIPLFAERRQRMGEAHAWRFGVQVTGGLFLWLTLMVILAFLTAPFYLRWLAPGFAPSERSQAVRTARLMLPAVSFMGIASLIGAALQSYRRFARPSLVTAVYNLIFIVCLTISFVRPLDRAGWGVTLGALTALALQMPLLWRYRPQPTTMTIPRSIDFEALRAFFQLATPLAAGYAVHHLILFIDRAMATELGAGKAAALNYAYHLALVVGQVSGLAVSTALFPRLAEQVAEGNVKSVRADLSDALGFVLLIGLPAACGLVLMRTPLVRVLFEHGAFDQAATAAVSKPLMWYAIAVLVDALCQPFWRVVYALRNSWTVLIVNGLQTGLRLVGNLALIPFIGYNGLALSAALGLSVQMLVLGWLIRRRLGNYLTWAWSRDTVRVLLAAVLMTGVVLSVAAHPADKPGGWPFGSLLAEVSAITRLAVGSIVGGLTYVLMLWGLGYGLCSNVRSITGIGQD